MRNLFRYLINNYGFFLFLSLEILSLFLVVNNNNFQKVKYLNSSNKITASIYDSYNSVVNYFGLNRTNIELAEENAKLRTMLESSHYPYIFFDTITESNVETDSSVFRFTSAFVIDNSVNRQFNYITLNKGSKDGIQPDQGIISPNGIVGVITNVTNSYSVGLSLLNQRWTVSAKLKKNDFFGSLAWDGGDYRTAKFLEIPFHVGLQVGDTIVTSGLSSIFPEGILIGTINSFEQPEGENYYDITVRLSTNFKALTYVDVIENRGKDDIEKLESLIQDDSGDN